MPAPLVLRHKKSYIETNLADVGLKSDRIRF